MINVGITINPFGSIEALKLGLVVSRERKATCWGECECDWWMQGIVLPGDNLSERCIRSDRRHL